MATPLNVLVVDDDPGICRVLEALLSSQGCSVRLAHDGLEALAIFKRQPAEVVITDLRMPKLNGYELIRELKRQDSLLNVVVITALPTVEGAVEAMRCGACDFITKPFDLPQIQTILSRCSQRLTVTRQVANAGEGASKLEELNRRLAELNDLKSQFLAALSHGLNTPMCLMSEWIYLLSDGTLGPLSGDQQHAVDALIQAYGRLQRLLQQLIDLMQGSEVLLRRQRTTIQELVRRAVEEATPKAATRNIVVACRMPEEPIPVDIDRVRGLAALEYVLDNAIKFNHEGGRVDVEVEAGETQMTVHIRDTGRGIPPEECQKVLTPFYQLDQRMKGALEGVGVGLSLAKRYAELHGGSLQLASQVGQGTTVIMTLPRPATLEMPPHPDPSPL